MIAALFVETNGCYFGLPGVDPWDIKRDARLYRGPSPVVAHPPCERWGRFAEGSMTRKIHRAGDDAGCFASALASLRKWGGVLEHPAHSKAWDAFSLVKPLRAGWTQAGENEWTCEVEQGHYGHPARKKTWLYFAGPKPVDLIWGPAPQRLPAKRLAERGYESARRCGVIANMSSRQRQRTPPEFRDLLISLVEAHPMTESKAPKPEASAPAMPEPPLEAISRAPTEVFGYICALSGHARTLEGIIKGLRERNEGMERTLAGAVTRGGELLAKNDALQSRLEEATPNPCHRVPKDVAEALSRDTPWSPEEALEFYAAGKHFDTVPALRGELHHTRILDVGAIASSALKSLDAGYLELKGDSELADLKSRLGEVERERNELIHREHSALEQVRLCGLQLDRIGAPRTQDNGLSYSLGGRLSRLVSNETGKRWGAEMDILNADRDHHKADADRLAEALEEYRQAMEFTRQYVGYETLPAIKGWSWFDADQKADEALRLHREEK